MTTRPQHPTASRPAVRAPRATPDTPFRPRSRVAQLVIAVAGLTALAALAFGAHVSDGGLYNDDWVFADTTRGSTGGVLGAIGAFGWYGFRPVAQVWLPLTHLVTGSDPRGLLAINLALAVLMATALWWLLRLLGVQLAHALAIAGLVLVFPGADSVRLWPAAGISQLALALWLVGAGVALLGLTRTGRRAWAFHGGALALYAAAILTYEAVAGVVMVSVLLYLSRTGWSRWGRRRAASRWGADLAVAAGALIYVSARSWNHPIGASAMLEHARSMARDAFTLLARSTVPFGSPPTRLVGGVLALTALAGIIMVRRLPFGSARRTELRRWLLTAGLGALAIPAGYALFVSGDPAFYQVLGPGEPNRTNTVAAIGFVVVIYALAQVALRSLGLERLATGLVPVAVGLTVACVVGIGYVHRARADTARWDRAAGLQDQIVAGVRAALPRLPHGATVYAFGAPAQASQGVPVFEAVWDLRAALREAYSDRTLLAYPAVAGTSVDCGAQGLSLRNWNSRFSSQFAPYGAAWFVEPGAHRAARITDRVACRTAARTFQPGPTVAWTL